MKKLVVITIAALSLSSILTNLSFADVASTKHEINNLARAIQDALIDTSAGESNLIAAKNQLQAALNLLRQSGNSGPVSEACLNFAYSKYYQILSSADAMTKAGQACRKTDSLEVMQYLYEKFYQTQTAVSAMDSASEAARAPMAGKLDIVRYAYDKFFLVLTAVDSANKAADGARKVLPGAIDCLQSTYSKYFQTQTANNAMDSAFTFCAN